jgi:hypothetical protein
MVAFFSLVADGGGDMDLLGEILETRGAFARSHARVISAHPGWDKNRDARLAVFGRCATTLGSVYPGVVHVKQNIRHPEWRHATSVNPVPDRDQLYSSLEFHRFLKGSFLQFTNSAVETALRLLFCFSRNWNLALV